MPIRPEMRDRYPKNWPEISAAIRLRAGNRCERCGVPNYELGGRTSDGTWFKAQPTGDNGLRLTWPNPGDLAYCGTNERGYVLRVVRIVLTVAHLNHIPEDCRPENLQALCQRCHNRLDAPMRAAGIKARRRATAAAGDLFPEGGKP